MAKLNSKAYEEEFRRQKRELELTTCKTASTQMRYFNMLGRGTYMEKVRKGILKLDPDILERFIIDGDAK
jgi:hypothetical protein